MVIPVDEESFNLITKSSKKIVEFVNGLKEDDKLISAVKSIPNMDSYLDGGEVAPILIAMSAQDIVSCLDALFGDVKLTTTGGKDNEEKQYNKVDIYNFSNYSYD